jgi:hypothetical protein
MTQISPNVGLIWGASTGERAAKYSVAPGLHVGAIFQAEVSRHVFVSFRALRLVGGRIREKTCVADYGAIGGVQEVNCRLAASSMAPAETLKLLLNAKPDNANQISFQLNYRF